MTQKKIIRLKLFALLADAAGCSTTEVTVGREVDTVAGLLVELKNRYPALADYSGPVLAARNKQYIALDSELSDGDELALFPPVSGG